MAALTLALKMKTHASETGAIKSIAREAAMEFSRSSMMPSVGTRVPGITNVLADDLSRYYEPGAPQQGKIPEVLKQVKRDIVPPRAPDYCLVPSCVKARKRATRSNGT